MCGRYSLSTKAKLLALAFDLTIDHDLQPRYNVAPMQRMPVIRSKREGGRQLDMMQWGLVPSWVDDPKIGNQTINARSESAAQRPMFRSAFKQRRCLVPADGFYEWQKIGKIKQPYFIRKRDGGPFAFAGLWEQWRGKDDHVIDSFTILTTEPNELMKPIHNRMPVIIPETEYEVWLDPANDNTELLQQLLNPYKADQMTAYPVSRQVSSPRNDSPACIQPVEPEQPKSLFSP